MVWVDGEPNGLSEVGDGAREDGIDDGSDESVEFVGVYAMDEFVTVVDRSRVTVVA